ncbi:MAG: division/cell wall cluster transcriptional repressor MraZ [Nitrospinota bacterium]
MSAYHGAIDQKGRVSVPARFREHLQAHYGDRLILVPMDSAIFVYPLEEWKRRFEDKIRDLPTNREEVRRFVRNFYARAAECAIDRQGRILIPPHLRDQAGIQKDVVVVGVSNKLEVWGRERWEEQEAQSREQMESIAEGGLVDLDF